MGLAAGGVFVPARGTRRASASRGAVSMRKSLSSLPGLCGWRVDRAPPLKGWAILGRPCGTSSRARPVSKRGNAVGVHASACPAGRDLFEDRSCWAPTGLQHPSTLALHPGGLVGGHTARGPRLDTPSFRHLSTARPPAGKGHSAPCTPGPGSPWTRLLGRHADSRPRHAIRSLPRPSAFSLQPSAFRLPLCRIA